MASVVGVEAPLSLWASVAGSSEDDLARSADARIAARMIDESPGRAAYRFTHWLVQLALYERLSLPRRRALHRRIADVMAGEPTPDPDRVADHLVAAGDERAAGWRIQAGDRAGRAFPYATAASRYEQALARSATRLRRPIGFGCCANWRSRTGSRIRHAP